MKEGDIVINSDNYIGKATKIEKDSVEMEYRKVIKGRLRTETWDKDFVRLANKSEIKKYEQIKGE